MNFMDVCILNIYICINRVVFFTCVIKEDGFSTQNNRLIRTKLPNLLRCGIDQILLILFWFSFDLGSFFFTRGEKWINTWLATLSSCWEYSYRFQVS